MTDLNRISVENERRVLRAFKESIQEVKSQVVLSDIIRALEQGNISVVLDILHLDDSTFESLEEAIRQAYRDGGLTGVEQIGPVPTETGTLVMRFNMRSPRVETWLSEMSSRLITELANDQRQMVRERLTDGIAKGVAPRQSALDLIGRIDTQTKQRTGGFIGMTSQQAGWVSKAREELQSLDANYLNRELRDKRFDGRVQRAIRNGKPLTKRDIDAMITNMQNKTLKYRGEVISRSESINALRAGQYEAIQQAAERGEVDVQEIEKSWDSTGDARTRLDHLQMEQIYKEKTISFGEAFVAPDGSRLMFPGDTSLGASGSQTIQCRCKAIYRIDFIKRQMRIEGFA